MSWQEIYLVVSGAAAVGWLNWFYIRHRGFDDPERAVMSTMMAAVMGAAWPFTLAVLPGRLILARRRRRDERRRILDTPVEKLGER